MPNQRLLDLADALDAQAIAVEYVAGVVRKDGDETSAARVEGEAQIMRNWAQVNRALYAAN